MFNIPIEQSGKNESIAAPKLNRNSVDCSTITDVNADNVPEVEIVSLVEESIPRYRLTQDYLTQFGGTENADWVINTPVLATTPTLTPEQAEATLDYLISCGFSTQKQNRNSS